MERLPGSGFLRACAHWVKARQIYTPLLAMAVATVVLILALTGISIYYEVELHRVGPELHGIRGRMVPAAYLLTNGRTALRGLDAAIEAALIMDGGPGETSSRWSADVDTARKGLGDHVAVYLTLPADHRPTAAVDLASRLKELDAALADLLPAIELRDAARLRACASAWRRASNRLDASLARLVDLHFDDLTGRAERIERLWADTTAGALGLAALDLFLILITTWAVATIIRRQRLLDLAHESEMDLFARRVAHDVLSPLQAIQLSAESVAGSEDPRVRKVAVHCTAAVHRSREVVDALLEFARAGAKPNPDEACAVEPLLSGLMGELRPQARAAGIDLQLDCASPGSAACPSGVLVVIVTNLVRNAIRYMGDGPERQIVVRARRRPRTVRIAVEDTGPGLPPDFAARAFEPYVRGPGATGPGLGLGLATVRRLATACGGATGVRPRPRRGSTFWVVLPRRPAA